MSEPDLRIPLDEAGIAAVCRDWLLGKLREVREGIDHLCDECGITDPARRQALREKAIAKATPLLLRRAHDDAEAFRREGEAERAAALAPEALH